MPSNPSLPPTLSEAACHVLQTASPGEKVRLTRLYAEAWTSGELSEIGNQSPPDRPARPNRPELKHPNDMPRRKMGGIAGKRAFIHSIAHIELNAIDLSWDIVCRFTGEQLPLEFYSDWVTVALDEADHFDLLENRLRELDASYGDLPAHDGLWEAATNTKQDLLDRLAIVPLILEARGLDTAPVAVERLEQSRDYASAAILRKIGEEEIPHVAAGVRWFEYLCGKRRLPPVPTFKEIAREKYAGRLKPPFNVKARSKAGMAEAYYQP